MPVLCKLTMHAIFRRWVPTSMGGRNPTIEFYNNENPDVATRKMTFDAVTGNLILRQFRNRTSSGFTDWTDGSDLRRFQDMINDININRFLTIDTSVTDNLARITAAQLDPRTEAEKGRNTDATRIDVGNIKRTVPGGPAEEGPPEITAPPAPADSMPPPAPAAYPLHPPAPHAPHHPHAAAYHHLHPGAHNGGAGGAGAPPMPPREEAQPPLSPEQIADAARQWAPYASISAPFTRPHAPAVQVGAALGGATPQPGVAITDHFSTPADSRR